MAFACCASSQAPSLSSTYHVVHLTPASPLASRTFASDTLRTAQDGSSRIARLVLRRALHTLSMSCHTQHRSKQQQNSINYNGYGSQYNSEYQRLGMASLSASHSLSSSLPLRQCSSSAQELVDMGGEEGRLGAPEAAPEPTFGAGKVKSLAERLRCTIPGESGCGEMGVPERGVYVSASMNGDVRLNPVPVSDMTSGVEPTMTEVLERQGELSVTSCDSGRGGRS